MVFKREKFPNNIKQMNKDRYKYVISRITYWIIEPTVFNEFIKFDIRFNHKEKKEKGYKREL